MFSMGFRGGGWFMVFDVKPSVRLSEGAYSEKSSLKFCTCFERVVVGAGGLGCLRSNLACDFQRGLIAKKVI